MWAVVHFEKEASVEAVPSKWLLKETRECFWPPKNWGNYKIRHSINNSDDPGVDWKVYQVKVLGEYENLNKARKKAKKAITTSDLSSYSESYVPPKKQKRFHQNSQSSSSSGDDTSVSSFINTLPTLSSKTIQTVPLSPVVRVQSPVLKSTPTTESLSTMQDTPRNEFYAGNKSTMQDTQRNAFYAGNNDTEFQKQVLRQLFIMKNMLIQQTESIDFLMKQRNENNNEESTLFSEENNPHEITAMMPIQTLADMETIETALHDENIFKSMTKFLAQIGGSTVKEIIRRIMYQTFSNTVGMAYSWEGAKKKKIFKNLKLADAILKAVRLNKRTRECADDQIIFFIKSWLVRAKDRHNLKKKSASNENNG